MNGRYEGFEDMGQADLIRMFAREAQITTAKQLHDHNEQVRAIRASMKARNEAEHRSLQERDRIQAEREAESSLIETLRHAENRRVAKTAIWVAGITGGLSIILSIVGIYIAIK